jgi:hypothetical protein
MAVATPFTQKMVLDFVAGGATPVRPGERWLALFDASGNEIALPAYSRRSATFAAAAAGECSLAAPVTFAMTGATPLLVRSVALFDRATGGSRLLVVDCSVSAQANGAGANVIIS